MRVVLINTVLNGSTGKITRQIADIVNTNGSEVWTFTSFQKKKNQTIRRSKNDLIVGGFFEYYSHILFSRFTGITGVCSILGTKILINKLEIIKPDVIHIHNLHDSYINLPILFNYLKKTKVKVIWTLHDCWPFTGRCPYFQITDCSKWKTGCINCPYPSNEYPKSYIDNCDKMWKLKKKVFCGVPNMTIVTPSVWLKDIAKQSFLREYNIEVIKNGIDLSVFKPIKNNFKKKNGIESKTMLLGVSFAWGYRKGLDIFIALSKILGEEYQIVLVGTNEEIDKKLPNNIISIHTTSNQHELAQIYSAADIFINPTREDNYPTVNLEAISCGTPVITFKTGGSPESVSEDVGFIVADNDLNSLVSCIEKNKNCKKNMEKACVEKSICFDYHSQLSLYLSIYQDTRQ